MSAHPLWAWFQRLHMRPKAAAAALGLCGAVALAQPGGTAAPARPGERADARATAVRPMPQAAAKDAAPGEERNLTQWLTRMHEASRQRAYAGTFVVSSVGGGMSSSRIWHVCEGEQQVERVDALTGAPRTTFRNDDQVVTFFPNSRQVQVERRESLRSFPDLMQAQGSTALAELYSAKRLGSDRVAGLDADVIQVEPRDKMRFGYRIWSEKNSGLVLKLQTLDVDGRALEQAAFSELQLDTRINKDQLIEMMHNTKGYRVEKVEPTPTTAAAEGWVIKPQILGFHLLSCMRRTAPNPEGLGGPNRAAQTQTVQWIYSDGLASVSMFVGPVDPRTPTAEISLNMGATSLLSRQFQKWWMTVVGEAPMATLQVFSQSLERAH